jgi:hypothetical protein
MFERVRCLFTIVEKLSRLSLFCFAALRGICLERFSGEGVDLFAAVGRHQEQISHQGVPLPILVFMLLYAEWTPRFSLAAGDNHGHRSKMLGGY